MINRLLCTEHYLDRGRPDPPVGVHTSQSSVRRFHQGFFLRSLAERKPPKESGDLYRPGRRLSRETVKKELLWSVEMKFPPTITSSIRRGRAGDGASARGREPRHDLLRWLRTPRNALGLSALAAGITAGSRGGLFMTAPPPEPPPPGRLDVEAGAPPPPDPPGHPHCGAGAAGGMCRRAPTIRAPR